MKKIVYYVGGAVLITTPLLAATVNNGINDNLFNSSKPSLELPNYSFPSHLISENLDRDAKGIISSVTYYGKREGKKEKLDIYIDSQTMNKEDACFLMVSVYGSDGGLEYRLDTTTVKYTVATHYIIEIDPPENKNETYREVKVAGTFYSNETNRHQYIDFQIDYPKESNYTFEENIEYISNYPIAVIHRSNGSIEKIYENIDFNNICNLNFETPIFDINKMNLKYAYKFSDVTIPNFEECYLLIEGLYDSSDIEEVNGMKKIPLNLVFKNDKIYFELINKYYYDSNDGMLYQTDKSGRNEISKLIIPSTFSAIDKAVYYELHFEDFTAERTHMTFKSYATFEYKWFGACGSSYFCVKIMEELLDNANYSGGVTI